MRTGNSGHGAESHARIPAAPGGSWPATLPECSHTRTACARHDRARRSGGSPGADQFQAGSWKAVRGWLLAPSSSDGGEGRDSRYSDRRRHVSSHDARRRCQSRAPPPKLRPMPPRPHAAIRSFLSGHPPSCTRWVAHPSPEQLVSGTLERPRERHQRVEVPRAASGGEEDTHEKSLTVRAANTPLDPLSSVPTSRRSASPRSRSSTSSRAPSAPSARAMWRCRRRWSTRARTRSSTRCRPTWATRTRWD